MGNGQSTVAAHPISAAWPKLLAPLLAIELGLVAAYFLTRTHILGEQMALWFDLDREHSVGSWFSSGQLLATGAALALTPARPRTRGAPASWFLKLMAAGFAFLSLDETIGVHEAISTMVHRRVAELELGWMPLYLAVAAIGVAVCARQILDVWRRHPAPANLFLAGAVVFLGGGLILELAGSVLDAYASPAEIVFEEYAEMAGASLMLCAALCLRERLGGPALRWG